MSPELRRKSLPQKWSAGLAQGIIARRATTPSIVVHFVRQHHGFRARREQETDGPTGRWSIKHGTLMESKRGDYDQGQG